MIMTLLFVVVLGALAVSALYLAMNTTLSGRLWERGQDLQYAAQAGLQMGKSYLNGDPTAMPADSFAELAFNGGAMLDADGNPVRNLSVRVFVGPSGNPTGQFGLFGSVVAEARDTRGGRVVRRLEVARESFAKFAYWSNRENNMGTPIWFVSGDELQGPVWSNDTLRILLGGAPGPRFRDNVGTASIILNPTSGTFDKGYAINQRPIVLPTATNLNYLQAYATAGNLDFTPPTIGDETTVRTRIEFVTVDVNGNGSDRDPEDGFLRIYEAAPGQEAWLRAAPAAEATNCGAWYIMGGRWRFVTIAKHGDPGWFAGYAPTDAGSVNDYNTYGTDRQRILSSWRSRCYLGGDPLLASADAPTPVPGEWNTFTDSTARGRWRRWPGAIDPRIAGRPDAAFLFPLSRALNTTVKGVINVNGTVGVSGKLSGRITLRSTHTIVILDDVTYATNSQATGLCVDILGMVSGADVVVSDNMLNNQVQHGPDPLNPADRKMQDDTKDLFIQSVVMATGTSFRVENFGLGPRNNNVCAGRDTGRGCLYLLGGLIQDRRGAVGTTAGTGFLKQYTYDKCALRRPPPYFPTTGRYTDNRYAEIDPVRFNVRQLFEALQVEP
jgi:hypothetical protein